MIKNNVIADFEIIIEDMIAVRPLPSLKDRHTAIEAVNEDFYKISGQNLPNYILSMLSDWFLIEILNDKDVDKVTNSEFAILSPRQLKRRDKRENSVLGEVMDYLNLKFVKKNDGLSKKVKKASEY